MRLFDEDSPWVAPLAALQFLTIFPPLIRRQFTPKELGGSTVCYPLVGALLGLLLWGADFLLAFVFPVPLRSALILVLWVSFSGALHLDGFLDACDGLFGGRTPESRLEIMRDERIGAFALAGGVLLFLTKFTALDVLAPGLRPAALVLAPALGRWSMVFALAAFPYARAQGLGREIKDHTRPPQFVLASVFVLLICWFSAGWAGVICLATIGWVVWFAARFTMRRIPGLTGDIYGALNELVEVATLLIMLAVFTVFP